MKSRIQDLPQSEKESPQVEDQAVRISADDIRLQSLKKVADTPSVRNVAKYVSASFLPMISGASVADTDSGQNRGTPSIRRGSEVSRKNLIEKNLRQAVKDGKIKLVDKNSSFIELWYIREFCNAKVLVNGVEHGIGWLKDNLPSLETIRVTWSDIRNAKNKAFDTIIMTELRKCPQCARVGKTSRLNLKDGDSKLGVVEVYFDEEEVKHVHDTSVIQTIYTCTNGHVTLISNVGHCPSCKWVGHS